MSLPVQLLRAPLLALVATGAIGCADPAVDDETASAEQDQPGAAAKSDDATPAVDVAHPLPATSGSFRARYVVPTPSELADASTYEIERASWLVQDGVATLQYALPEGLVGGRLDVHLAGALAPDATAAELTGVQGEGRCTATATTLTCRETFGDLGELPMSLDVVRRVAARDFGGPIAHREQVANLFGSDPIGAVEIDLLAPADGAYDDDADD
jgi:hypothetical protein